MAQRRMFSLQIVSSDAFLEMPISTQALYFHLGMYADDDGFVNPKKIMRMIGTPEDDLKVLIAKRFVLTFESGVIVIKAWKMNNFIRPDRYHETQYLEEKNSLDTKDNGMYTERLSSGIPKDNQRSTEVRLGKGRLGKKKAAAKAAAPAPAPYDPKETRKKWYDGSDEAFQLMAWFFDEKDLWKKFDTREKLQAAGARHLRSARRIIAAGWSEKECAQALGSIKKNDKLLSEWTIDTLDKYLTK